MASLDMLDYRISLLFCFEALKIIQKSVEMCEVLGDLGTGSRGPLHCRT